MLSSSLSSEAARLVIFQHGDKDGGDCKERRPQLDSRGAARGDTRQGCGAETVTQERRRSWTQGGGDDEHG
jgi:hypothetical protein